MRRIIGLALCLVIGASVLAAAAEVELQGPMFLPVAYINERGKIMDKNHVLLGRIDKDGIVYDTNNQHLGFVGKDLAVLDVHHKTLVTIDENGVMMDAAGTVIGAISDAKLTDASGKAFMRYEAPGDKRGILAYFFFFSPGFGN